MTKVVAVKSKIGKMRAKCDIFIKKFRRQTKNFFKTVAIKSGFMLYYSGRKRESVFLKVYEKGEVAFRVPDVKYGTVKNANAFKAGWIRKNER